MRNRWIVSLAFAGVLAAALGLGRITVSALPGALTLTPMGASNILSPIGIDWLPGVSGTDQQLLASVNGDPGGTPYNFAKFPITTPTAGVQWSTQANWINEIYFSAVRPDHAAGWVTGDVYSANTDNPNCIAKFSADGSSITPCWATLKPPATPETKLKRGGVRFDYTGTVAGGDLIVLADSNVFGGPADLYRINSAGTSTLVKHIGDVHAEGIFVIPADAAKYGPWAGMILVGEEHGSDVEAIPPNCANACSTIRYHIGQGVEDIWIPKAGEAFFGMDYHGSVNGEIWTASAAAVAAAGLVGEVLFQSEGTLMFAETFNGGVCGAPPDASCFTQTVVNSGQAGQNQWEHMTFAPEPVPGGPSHGCTPGFWKNHTTVPPWGPNYFPNTTMGQVGFLFPVPPFSVASHNAFLATTMLTALQGGGGKTLDDKTKILLRAATAAVLNADNGNPPYPLTVAQIIQQVNAALASGNLTTITTLAGQLDQFNNQCDLQ